MFILPIHFIKIKKKNLFDVVEDANCAFFIFLHFFFIWTKFFAFKIFICGYEIIFEWKISIKLRGKHQIEDKKIFSFEIIAFLNEIFKSFSLLVRFHKCCIICTIYCITLCGAVFAGVRAFMLIHYIFCSRTPIFSAINLQYFRLDENILN